MRACSYAREFVASDPGLALEYCMRAAEAAGGTQQVKGALLRELLVGSRAYGFLLGAGGATGDGSALARFVPDRAARLQLISAVADECKARLSLHMRRHQAQEAPTNMPEVVDAVPVLSGRPVL